MQVFVRKSSLAASDPISVIGVYDDSPVLSRMMHGSDFTVLSLPLNAIENSAIPVPPDAYIKLLPPPQNVLKPSFRQEYMNQMVNGEAQRRILESFPDYMQRNANADINASTVEYGPDWETWPQAAKDRKIINDTGWTYVNSIRARSDALETQLTLTDPTDDSHWPTRIPPIYI